MDAAVLESLRTGLNNRVTLRERSNGAMQVIAPFYHEDGDMYDIFIDSEGTDGRVRVCDHGLTLMRLSYTYELDTPKKEEIFNKILSDNRVENDDGNLFIEVLPSHVNNAVLRLTQVVSKITNMQVYRREVVRSMFYDDLTAFISETLGDFSPNPNYLPLADREDLEVDYCFSIEPKKLFLFGVKDSPKARLVTISCLEYMRKNVSFRSIIVHEDFDALSSKDRRIITNVADKQFTDLADFRSSGRSFLVREAAS